MELKINIPEGYEIDTEKSTLGHLILKEIKKKVEWEDFGEVDGWYLDSMGKTVHYDNQANYGNKNTFPTREEAEACLALSQLLQWRNKYNEGWKAEFYIGAENICIFFLDEAPYVSINTNIRRVLSFKSETIAQKFLSDFRDLIEIAKPLL